MREEIDRHAFDKLVVGHLEKGLVGAGAGVVDENIDAAELVFYDAWDHFDLFDFGHVQRVSLDLRLGGPHNVVSRIGERCLPARANKNFHALARERACRLKAYSFAPAGDQRRLARKSQFHRAVTFQKISRMSPQNRTRPTFLFEFSLGTGCFAGR